MRRARAWRALLASVALAGSGPAQDQVPQDPVAFERQVLPILEARCFDCHRAPAPGADGRIRQPKGGLRLDGRTFLLRGGDGGPVLAPGRPEDSELWLRTALPADDPDLMPAKGAPLTPVEIELLRRWIAAGADLGSWQGAAPADPAAPAAADRGPPPRIGLLLRLAAGLEPAPAAAIDRLEGEGHAMVRSPLGADRRLLRVSFPAHQAEIDDAALRALAPLREHIAELELGRSAVLDAGLAEVARLPRLVRLDLSRTQVGDAGLRRLAGLEQLRSLNLFATQVGDGAVDAIAALPALEVVHVWQSRISADGIAALRRARPDLRVVGAPEFPPPADADGEAPARRRR
jgi:hypothetical protein